ncbi:MAG: hypothetical protein EOQ52_12725 [Mesorhizobium sp.]|uniref:hypothetical protein n=1 Tax=Mesorhizobium sp. TaxID=1871066 RepID=UPI000FE7933A|nr:hypothetical protein [Mesorhizobium sp.]RWB89233.1 MAG: hypothetical protein EOQ52_12725 [Mesorhizobium sp.]
MEERKAMKAKLTNAADMARSVGIDPKAFRRALRAEQFAWHSKYSTWSVTIDSAEHIAMRAVLAALLSNKSTRLTVKVDQPKVPAAGEALFLESGWYSYVLPENVDEKRPGIYQWNIDGVGSYIGKYTWINRPKQEYEKNILKILNGRPYRPQKPAGFRRIHRELFEAARKGLAITLTILENVEPALLNQRERELIAERGTLNGPKRN